MTRYIAKPWRHSSVGALLLATSLPFLSIETAAEVKTWIADSGDWNVAANWNPSGEPVTNDAVNLTQSDAVSRDVNYVTTLSPTPELSSLLVDATGSGVIRLLQGGGDVVVTGESSIGVDGSGSYEQSGGSSSFNVMRIGLTSTGDGIVSLSGGSTVINELRVAFDPGSAGKLEVQDSGDLTVSGPTNIGQSGNGVLEQTGGTAQFDELVVGLTSQGAGSATLSGGTTNASRLIIAKDGSSSGAVSVVDLGNLNVSSSTTIGQGGTGELNQSGGTTALQRVDVGLTSTGVGTFNLSNGDAALTELFVGLDAGSSGTVNVSGGTLEVSGTASIGNGSAGTYSQSGGEVSVVGLLYAGRSETGDGTLDLTGGSLVAGQLIVAQDEGAAGHVAISGAAQVTLDSATIAQSGHGTVNQAAGELAVSGNLFIGRFGQGSYEMSGGFGSVGIDVYIADDSDSVGSLIVTDGEFAVGDTVAIGVQAGSSGTLELGGGTLTIGENLNFGIRGEGHGIQSGGTLDVGNVLALGVGDPASSGSYEMLDGSLIVGQQLQVGSVGTGLMTQSGGQVEVRSVLLGGNNAEGTMVLDGGTLSALANINVGNGLNGVGSFTQKGGRVSAGQYLDIGVSSGSEGLYELNDGELSVGDQVSRVGNAGSAEFRHSGGTHTVAGSLSLAEQTGSNGTYRLSGDGALQSVDLYLGGLGTGIFEQLGGANTVRGGLYIGRNAGGDGTYDLQDGSLVAESNEFVGYSGNGNFVQSGGDHRVWGDLYIGRNAGSEGVYDLRSGRLTVEGDLHVGEVGDNGVAGVGRFVQSGGVHEVFGRLTVGDGDLAAGADRYTLAGGTLSATTLINNETFDYRGGSLATQVLLWNTGDFNVEGPGERDVGGLVVLNTGRFKVTDTTVRFNGLFLNLGIYESDPSRSFFNDLEVQDTGYLVGGLGDEFIVKGDFINMSTQDLAWNTSEATLRFVDAAVHDMYLPAADSGAGGATFDWGVLDLTGVTLNLLDGNTGNLGTALYVDTLIGALLDETGMLTNLLNRTGDDWLSLYFDPENVANAYLVEAGYNGVIDLPKAPAIPSPSPVLLMLLALITLLAAHRVRQ